MKKDAQFTEEQLKSQKQSFYNQILRNIAFSIFMNAKLKAKPMIGHRKPLQLKQSIQQTLDHNNNCSKDCKTIVEPCPGQTVQQKRQSRIRSLFDELQKKESSSDEQESQDLLICDLQAEDDEPNESLIHQQKMTSKDRIFKHLFNHPQFKQRNATKIQRKVQENLRRLSLEEKILQKKKKTKSLQFLLKQNEKKEYINEFRKISVKKRLVSKSRNNNKNKNDPMMKIVLDLSKMRLSYTGIQQFRDRLLNGKLKLLNLSYNFLANKCMPLISNVINRNCLEELNLCWNQFTYEAIGTLFAHLTSNISMLSLDISYNSLNTCSSLFLENFRNFLQNNKYLLHLNLQMCHMSAQQSQAIIYDFNFKNQTIVGLHFLGNGSYYVDKMGFIAKKNTDVEFQQKRNIIKLQKRDNTSVQSIRSIKPKRVLLRKENIGQIGDCCWYCEKWVCEQFKYYREIQPNFLNVEQQQLFIHLSCYDFAPLRMSTLSCLNYFGKRSNKLAKRIDWSNYEIYNIIIPVPQHENIHFFFSSKGTVFVSSHQKEIQFNQIVNFTFNDPISDAFIQNKLARGYEVYVKEINVKKRQQLQSIRAENEKKANQQKNMKAQKQKVNTNTIKQILTRNQLELKTSKSISSMQPLEERRGVMVKTTGFMDDMKATRNSRIPALSKQIKIQPTKQSNKDAQPFNRNRVNIALHFRRIKQQYSGTSIQGTNRLLLFSIVPRSMLNLYNENIINHFDNLANPKISPKKENLLQSINQYIDQHFSAYESQRFLNKYYLKIKRIIGKQIEFVDKYQLASRHLPIPTHLFTDFASYCLDKYIPMGSPQTRLKTNKQGKIIAKSVKFQNISISSSETGNSIVLPDSSTQMPTKKLPATEILIFQSSYVLRQALSLNCVQNGFRLKELKNMPRGTLNSLQKKSCKGLTQKSICSARNIKLFEEQIPKIKLSFEEKKQPKVNLRDELLIKYSNIAQHYIREPYTLHELLNQQFIERQKMSQACEVIVTHNFYKLSRYYQTQIHAILQDSLRDMTDLKWLSCFLPNEQNNIYETSFIKNSLRKLQASRFVTPVLTEQKVNSISEEEKMQYPTMDSNLLKSLYSLFDYLSNYHHPIKIILNRKFEHTIRSNRKRNGKYGRSLKNIKQQLLGEKRKIVLPSDNQQLMQEIQKERKIILYNNMMREINFVSDVFMSIVEEMVEQYKERKAKAQNQQEQPIFKWIILQSKEQIGDYLLALIKLHSNGEPQKDIISQQPTIMQQYFLNTLLELCKLQLTLETNAIQDYQLRKKQKHVSYLFNYEAVLTDQTHLLARSLALISQQSTIINSCISKTVQKITQIWKEFQWRILLGKEKGSTISRKSERQYTSFTHAGTYDNKY